MSYFKSLFGFSEESPDQVRANLKLEGNQLTSLVNHRSFQWGELQLPSLADLRKYKPYKNAGFTRLQVDEVVGDVQHFHLIPDYAGALFQAASQFNLLEMVSPAVSPEAGISGYVYDKTQGPACAIACAAGTLYRNYFVEVDGQTGQTESSQINTLDDIGRYFGNEEKLWAMRNGYALGTEAGLNHINLILQSLSSVEYEDLKGLLKIGLQLDTQVTLIDRPQLVSQAYCSALPVAYSTVHADKWEAFARLVLEATYEATLHAALLNRDRTGNKRVFLTLIGGGAFGNRENWIADAAIQTLRKFAKEDLHVSFVSYGEKSGVVDVILRQHASDSPTNFAR